MGLIHESFPPGDWEVLGGGHVRLGDAPIPEYSYHFPIAPIRNSIQESAQESRFIKASIGDLPILTPGSIFSDGCRQQDRITTPIELSVDTGQGARRWERPLSKALEVFSPTDPDDRTISVLSESIEQLPRIGESPMVVYRETLSDRFVLCPASEWYRVVYGRNSAISHIFLKGSFDEIIDALVVREEFKTVLGSTLNTAEPVDANQEYLRIVPRSNVPDAMAPIVAQIYWDKFSRSNALYAGQSIRSSAATSLDEVFWLKFANPFYDQSIKIKVSGIPGEVRYRQDGEEICVGATFVTTLLGFRNENVREYVIPYRENDGRTASGRNNLEIDEAGAGKNSDGPSSKRRESYPGDNPDERIRNTPDDNPNPEEGFSRHFGPPFDDLGTNKPLKEIRSLNPDKSVSPTTAIPDDQDHDGSIKTTNQEKSKYGTAGQAHQSTRTELHEVKGLNILVHRLLDLQNKKTITKLSAVPYEPSEYSYKNIQLQLPPKSLKATKRGWFLMPGGYKRFRLMLCVTWVYQDQVFLALDLERRSKSNKYKAVLATLSDVDTRNDSEIRKLARSAAAYLYEEKGVARKPGLNKIFDRFDVLKHMPDKDADAPILSDGYLEKRMNELISKSNCQ